MIRPNLFLVGHPRSGTGTWDGLLQSHPDIFMSTKELHYFGSDLKFNDPPRSLQNYLSYFPKTSQYKYLGDSSTWYLISETAAQEIYDFCPEAKIIISLRDPVSWLHSLHAHQYFSAYEDEPDFAKALSLEDIRYDSPELCPTTYPQMGVFYRRLVQYDLQVKRFLDVFGPDQVHVSFLHQSKSNIEQQWNELLSFLNLSKDYPQKEQSLEGNKKQRNANHVHRSRKLQKWLKSSPRRSILFGMQQPLIPTTRLMLRFLRKINMKNQKRKPLDSQIEQTLRHEFVPVIERLENILQQDLSIWKP